MGVGQILTYAFVAIWAGFVVRGLVTGRMLMRGGDIVKHERPRTYAMAMVGNVVALCFILGVLAFT